MDTKKIPKVKPINISYDCWKLLKQHSLDIDDSMQNILNKLIEDNLR